MLPFGIGLGLISVLIGFLCGFSQSPIVATVVPLLFAMSAAATAWLAPRDKDAQLTMQQIKIKLRLFGLQLMVFSPTFAAGLWLGIAVKASPFLLWPRGDDVSVVAAMPQTDPRILTAQMELEQAMIRSNICKDDRKQLFDQLIVGARQRGDAKTALDSKIDALVADWQRSNLDQNPKQMKKLSNDLKNLADSDQPVNKGALQDISTQLNSITTESGLTELGRLADLLDAIRDQNNRKFSGFANQDEIAAWNAAVEKIDTLKPDAKASRSIASEKDKNPDRLPG